MKLKWLWVLVLTVIILSGCSASPVFTVRHVYDGDSFVLTNSDEIRLIGIDAPEKDEPGADEARAFLTKLIKDKPIRLEGDKEDKDRYKRLLRYVYVGDTFVNAEMIKSGYAITLFIQPNGNKYQAEFTALETTAKETKTGIWAPDAPVYVTDFGQKYHRAGCRHLAKSKTAITLGEAKQKNYQPCKECKPAE